MFTFGQAQQPFDFAVSDDKRAFTLTFSEFQVVARQSDSRPISSRLFSLVLPLEGDDPQLEIDFSVSGFASTTGNATASMVFSVNGQTTVADFSTNNSAGQSFVQQLKFSAAKPSACRLSCFFLVGLDSKDPTSEATLSAATVDAEILPRPT